MASNTNWQRKLVINNKIKYYLYINILIYIEQYNTYHAIASYKQRILVFYLWTINKPKANANNSEKKRNLFNLRTQENTSQFWLKLNKKFQNNQNNIADNFISILGNKYFLFNCYESIKSNKGSLTQGTDNTTAESMSMKRIEKLSNTIKSKQFQFKPARRIEVPKPGKTTFRPLTIPNFDDRIVQEGIRIILNQIYEPIFSKIQANYGFRPKLGTVEAMDHIIKTTINYTTAIEGDIKGAFDNIDPTIMINILSKRIKDKHFLKIIKQGFHAGIFFKDIYYNSTLGIPQGGLASPILFNIYMHEFDIFVKEYIQNILDELNSIEERTGKPGKSYNKIRKLRENVINKMQTVLRQVPEINKFSNMTFKQKLKYRSFQKEFNQLTKKLRQTPSRPKKNQILKLSYTRYADDWIIISNCDLKSRIHEGSNPTVAFK